MQHGKHSYLAVRQWKHTDHVTEQLNIALHITLERYLIETWSIK